MVIRGNPLTTCPDDSRAVPVPSDATRSGVIGQLVQYRAKLGQLCIYGPFGHSNTTQWHPTTALNENAAGCRTRSTRCAGRLGSLETGAGRSQGLRERRLAKAWDRGTSRVPQPGGAVD